MHYNPFAYISKKNREKDILKFGDVLIKNTQSSQQNGGDDFWIKAKKLLYTAYIAMIFTINPPAEQNFETLIEMINSSECREDDETFKNAMDRLFEFIECWISGEYPNDVEISDEFAYMKEHQPNEEQKRLGASQKQLQIQFVRKQCRDGKFKTNPYLKLGKRSDRYAGHGLIHRAVNLKTRITGDKPSITKSLDSLKPKIFKGKALKKSAQLVNKAAHTMLHMAEGTALGTETAVIKTGQAVE